MVYVSVCELENMECDSSSETQLLDPEFSTTCMLESEDARRLECCCLLIALSPLEPSNP
jgi:hypothetical protein